jgi:hypothetical protein
MPLILVINQKLKVRSPAIDCSIMVAMDRVLTDDIDDITLDFSTSITISRFC